MSVDAVLSSERGLIVAPAGCGKTHLITDVLKVKPTKPYLVLTHTTAGVAALKQRLKRLAVPNEHYRVATIDGWALKVANMFPSSCMMSALPSNPQAFYPELRYVVNAFISSGHLGEIIRASYSRLLVDEYQDCDMAQHTLINSISNILPTTVFGDPMQAIFDFRGITLPCWNQVVQTCFPQVAALEIPWRWNNAHKHELGEWLLSVRGILIQGGSIDLQTCPGFVTWHPLTGNSRADSQNQNDTQYQLRNRNPVTDSLLIVGNSSNKESRHNFAKIARGIDVVEPVELADVVYAASRFDANQGIQLVEHVLDVATTMMTGVGRAQFLQRINSIIAGRNRTLATPLELSAQVVVEQGSRVSILNLLHKLEQNQDSRVYRNGAFSALKDTVTMSVSDSSKSMQEAASIIREQRRHSGDRRIPSKAIGSTLLLKGLEADHALILDAGNMNSKHLYVALTRGANSVTVYSHSNVVGGG